MQGAQLILPVPELQGQVYQEDAHIIELELDDEPLDTGIEVVKALAMHMRRRQEGICLLAHDGHEVVDGPCSVLALECRVMTDLTSDVLGLIHHSGTDRARIDLNEA